MWNLFYGGGGSSTEISSIILQPFIRWPLSFLQRLTEQHLWFAAYVRVCAACVSVCVFKFAFESFFKCLWAHLRVSTNAGASAHLMSKCVKSNTNPPPISFLSGLILSPEINLSFLQVILAVREKWALFPVADQYINSTAGDSQPPRTQRVC